MGKKRHTAEEIVAKLRQVDVLTAQGRPVAEAVRSIGVTEVSCGRSRTTAGDPSTAGSSPTRSNGSKNWRWRTPDCVGPSRISPWRS